MTMRTLLSFFRMVSKSKPGFSSVFLRVKNIGNFLSGLGSFGIFMWTIMQCCLFVDIFLPRNNSTRHDWTGGPGGRAGRTEGADQVLRHLQGEAGQADSEGPRPHQGTSQGNS